MRDSQSVGEAPRSIALWIRKNVIEVAPLWIQFYRSALSNVRIR